MDMASFTYVVVLVFVTLILTSTMGQQQFPRQPFPAFFIFGDSLVDVGNNNYIISIARANSRPFGIDFPSGPTGRFTNGKTVLDVIAELIDLPLVPPYLDPKTRGINILQGVNYASGAGGILQKTGFNYIGRIDFDTQLDWFENTISQLQQILGSSAAQDLIARSLYAIVLGSNDYINNYLLSTSSSKQYSPQQFQEILLNKFSSQLTRLYSLGARKIAVGNVGPLGCIPSQLAAQNSPDGTCSDKVNSLVVNFNTGLYFLLQQLNANLPGSRFVYSDTYTPVFDYRNNPTKYGFQVGSKGCCGLGKYNGQIPCAQFVRPCPDRDAYVFWDPFHPTQKANILLGNTLYQNVARNLI